MTELELLHGFCHRLVAGGIPVGRVNIVIGTLHPIHEGRVFRWRRDDQGDLDHMVEYGRTNVEGEAAANWRRSTYYHLLMSGEDILRRQIGPGHMEDFSVLADLRAEGQTDYLVLIHRFGAEGIAAVRESERLLLQVKHTFRWNGSLVPIDAWFERLADAGEPAPANTCD